MGRTCRLQEGMRNYLRVCLDKPSVKLATERRVHQRKDKVEEPMGPSNLTWGGIDC